MRRTCGLALLLSLTAAPAFAQQDNKAGWAPALVYRAMASWPDGVKPGITMDNRLTKEFPVSGTIWTGPTLCTVGGGERASASNVWTASAEYLGNEGGRHQIRVTAGFIRIAGRETSALTTQTLSLREGDSVVLDVLSSRVDGACTVHTVTFEAQLVMQAADQTLARARYTADLWLVHVDPSGQERREHVVATVSADQPATPFTFSPLTFAIPQLDPRQGNAAAVIRLSGSMRVRPRPQGDVAIDLETNRRVFALENPDRPAPQIGAALRMTLSTKDGETVAVDFPPPNGYSTISLSADGLTMRGGAGPGTPPASAPPDAVEVKGNALTLHTFQFFKGHKTQLLITLKKLP